MSRANNEVRTMKGSLKTQRRHPRAEPRNRNLLQARWEPGGNRKESRASRRVRRSREPVISTHRAGRDDGSPLRVLELGFQHWSICLRIWASLLGCIVVVASAAGAEGLSDQALGQIRFEQKLGTQVTPALSFRDEEGQPVQLSRYFGQKPVLLVLGYYQCPMLCTLVLNGMLESAADMKWSIGQDFQVVDVSINPQETPALAAAKRRAYLKRYGRPSAAQGWHFLTGDEPAIRQLADEVGFRYAYDAASKQYAHPSGLVVLTPEGKVSGYLFGVTFASQDLYGALKAASSHQVTSPIQQLILLCFHYNPITGKYSGLIIIILRGLAIFTMLGFLALIVMLVRRGRRAEAALAPAHAPHSTPAPSQPATRNAHHAAAP